MRIRPPVLVLLAALPLAHLGCQETAPETRPSPDVAAESAPADDGWARHSGRLTLRQMEMYIAVQQQALKESHRASSGDSRGLGDLAQRATADLRAARALGQDLDEYRWVKARVLEARPQGDPADTPVVATLEAATLETLERLQAEIEPQGQESLASETQAPSDPEAVAHNRRLRDLYRDELSAVEGGEVSGAPLATPQT